MELFARYNCNLCVRNWEVGCCETLCMEAARAAGVPRGTSTSLPVKNVDVEMPTGIVVDRVKERSSVMDVVGARRGDSVGDGGVLDGACAEGRITIFWRSAIAGEICVRGGSVK